MHIKSQIRLLIICFLIVAILFIAIMVVGFMVYYQANKANQMIDHTAFVNTQIGIVRSGFNVADIAGREKWVYRVDGDKVIQSRASLKANIESLKELVLDNQNQLKNIQKLEIALSEYFDLQDDLVEKSQKDGYESAARYAKEKNSSNLNMEVNNAMTIIQAEETSLLGERSRLAQTSSTSLSIVLILLAIGMLISVPSSFFIALFTMTERHKIAEKFKKMYYDNLDKRTNTMLIDSSLAEETFRLLESSKVIT